MMDTLDLSTYLDTLRSTYNEDRPKSTARFADYRRFIRTQAIVTDKLRKLFDVLSAIDQPGRFVSDSLSSCDQDNCTVETAKVFVFDANTFTHVYWAAMVTGIGYDALTKLVTKLHALAPEFVNKANVCSLVFDDLTAFADVTTICFYIDLFDGKLYRIMKCIVARLCERLEESDPFYMEVVGVDQILCKIASKYDLRYKWFNRLVTDAENLPRIAKMLDLFAAHEVDKEKTHVTIDQIFLWHYRSHRVKTIDFIRKTLSYIEPDTDSIIYIICGIVSGNLQQCIDITDIIQSVVTLYPQLLQNIVTIDFMLEQMTIYLHDSKMSFHNAKTKKVFSRNLPSIFPDVTERITKYCLGSGIPPVTKCYGLAHDMGAQSFLYALENRYDYEDLDIEGMAAVCSNVIHHEMLHKLKAEVIRSSS